MTLVAESPGDFLMLRTPAVTVAIVLGVLAFASPAAAQFGSIFNDPPPRPPGNVPVGPPSDDDRYYQTRPQIWPREPQQVAPPPPPPGYPPQQQAYPPPPGSPPQQQTLPRPGPDGLPPPPGSPQQAARPPGAPLPPGAAAPGAVQQQTLAPPPGATAAPPGPALPGLPPGQRQPRGTPQDAALQPGDEVVIQPPAQKIPNNQAVFSGLDKITGRIISFDVAIGETVQFGALQVTPRACYTRPPTESPNTDAFIEVDEITLQNEIKRIFTGWMFAASPGLHAVEHPIYDVWLADCKGAQTPTVAAVPEAPQPAAVQRPQQPKAPPRPKQTTQPVQPIQPPPGNQFPYVR
jgi:hypothetical protein